MFQGPSSCDVRAAKLTATCSSIHSCRGEAGVFGEKSSSIFARCHTRPRDYVMEQGGGGKVACYIPPDTVIDSLRRQHCLVSVSSSAGGIAMYSTHTDLGY